MFLSLGTSVCLSVSVYELSILQEPLLHSEEVYVYIYICTYTRIITYTPTGQQMKPHVSSICMWIAQSNNAYARAPEFTYPLFLMFIEPYMSTLKMHGAFV